LVRLVFGKRLCRRSGQCTQARLAWRGLGIRLRDVGVAEAGRGYLRPSAFGGGRRLDHESKSGTGGRLRLSPNSLP
jgi:hypothetical protein